MNASGPANLAERVRVLLSEYDDTLAVPLQAQDIAEADLRDGLVRALVDDHGADCRFCLAGEGMAHNYEPPTGY